jgi:broad-specificity NMP kinase
MTGPPAVGKTFYGNTLKDYYNIPIINVKEVSA